MLGEFRQHSLIRLTYRSTLHWSSSPTSRFFRRLRCRLRTLRSTLDLRLGRPQALGKSSLENRSRSIVLSSTPSLGSYEADRRDRNGRTGCQSRRIDGCCRGRGAGHRAQGHRSAKCRFMLLVRDPLDNHGVSMGKLDIVARIPKVVVPSTFLFAIGSARPIGITILESWIESKPDGDCADSFIRKFRERPVPNVCYQLHRL